MEAAFERPRLVLRRLKSTLPHLCFVVEDIIATEQDLHLPFLQNLKPCLLRVRGPRWGPFASGLSGAHPAPQGVVGIENGRAEEWVIAGAIRDQARAEESCCGASANAWLEHDTAPLEQHWAPHWPSATQRVAR